LALLLALAALSLGPAHARAGSASWNQFRGANGSGVAPADRIPAHLGPDTNVLWETAVPAGHSSPVIWGNHIFLTASDPANRKELTTLFNVHCHQTVGGQYCDVGMDGVLSGATSGRSNL
jgi:hypothetical protein